MTYFDNDRKYKKITRQQRVQLLNLILKQRNTIKRAAEIIGIGPSTARMILKKYEQTGEIFESRQDKNTRGIVEKLQIKKSIALSTPSINTEQNIQQIPTPNVYFLVYFIPNGGQQAIWPVTN